MNEAVLMAVEHGFHHLFEEYLGLVLLDPSFLLDVGQQLPAFEILHNYGHLHILKCEAVVDLHYVVVAQALQNFGLNEYAVDVCCRPDCLCLDCFDGELLLTDFVLSQ